jgi:hypothetical protein
MPRLKLAEVLAVRDPFAGPPVTDVMGATLSTVHVQVLSVDMLPLRSTARTCSVYVPVLGFGAYPELQVCHSCTPPIRHSKWLRVESDAALKLKVAGTLTTSLGPVREDIAGAVSSTKRARTWRFA